MFENIFQTHLISIIIFSLYFYDCLMRVIQGVIKNFGTIIEDVKKQVIENMKRGNIPAETSITAEFLGILQNEINTHGQEIFGMRGLKIYATILQDRGPKTDESEFGADFAMLLDINIDNFILKKGFFCQAKKEGKEIKINKGRYTTVRFSANREFKRLQGQVYNMLQITPDSFVLIYGLDEFVLVPASSVSGMTNSDSLYGKRIQNFFEEFLLCFIGDPRISDDSESWKVLKKSINKIIKIEIRQKEEKHKTKEEISPPTDFNIKDMTTKESVLVTTLN